MINPIFKFDKRLTQVKYVLLCALAMRFKKSGRQAIHTCSDTNGLGRPNQEMSGVT